MSNLKKLKELGVELVSGQIMSRVSIKDDSAEPVVETRRVIIPKAINYDGTISEKELPEEKLKVAADEKRTTKVGDIVLKLSTPYDAAIIEEDSKNCIVPSFCAIIRTSEIDKYFLLAFLNSSYCKDQIKAMVAGASMTVVSIGKISNIQMPLPSEEEQIRIGINYRNTQKKLNLLKQISTLEAQRNDIVIRDMVKKYE